MIDFIENMNDTVLIGSAVVTTLTAINLGLMAFSSSTEEDFLKKYSNKNYMPEID